MNRSSPEPDPQRDAPSVAELAQDSGWRKWLNRMDVDRAVGYAVLARSWQMVAGLLTTVLIATYFSPQTQGYYYTLIQLVGLQTLADSGLHGILMHFASHERAGFVLGERGEPSGEQANLQRVANACRFGVRWFGVAAVLFTAVVIGSGWYLLFDAPAGIAWQAPLILTALLAAVSLASSPLLAILEGCNEVRVLNRTRLLQVLTGSLVAWAAIASGLGLWTLVATTLSQTVWEAYLIFGRYRRTWMALRRLVNDHFDWRREIWPLQWRLLAQVASRHFAYTPLIPIVLTVQGAAMAGRLGMTWTVLLNLQMAALAWVRTRTPRFGMLVAEQNYRQLDREFRTTVVATTVAIVALLAAFIGTLGILTGLPWEWATNLSGRFLPWSTAACFAAIFVPSHLVQSLGMYLRAHKREPTLWVTCIGNAILGAVVIVVARQFSVRAVGIGMFAVVTAVMLPGVTIVWWRCRRAWHTRADGVTPVVGE